MAETYLCPSCREVLLRIVHDGDLAVCPDCQRVYRAADLAAHGGEAKPVFAEDLRLGETALALFAAVGSMLAFGLAVWGLWRWAAP